MLAARFLPGTTVVAILLTRRNGELSRVSGGGPIAPDSALAGSVAAGRCAGEADPPGKRPRSPAGTVKLDKEIGSEAAGNARR